MSGPIKKIKIFGKFKNISERIGVKINAGDQHA
jgi:hypothetical protein